MVEEQSGKNDFLDKCIWVSHCGDSIGLNIIIREHQFCSPPIDRVEWIDWLKEELAQCSPTEIPATIYRAFDG